MEVEKLTHTQLGALKNAKLSGELVLITSGWWSTCSGIGGPWASITINKLVRMKLMHKPNKETVRLTDLGREALARIRAKEDAK